MTLPIIPSYALVLMSLSMQLQACQRDFPSQMTNTASVVQNASEESADTSSRGHMSLRFGAVMYSQDHVSPAILKPLESYLHKMTGYSFDSVVYSDTDVLLNELDSGAMDIAVLPPLIYVEAIKRVSGLQNLATTTQEGSPTYLGYFVVRRDSLHHNLEALRGASVGYVSRWSTSGYLYPRSLLRSRRIDPDTFFSTQTFYGTHADVVRAVVQGEVEVGAVGQGFIDESSIFRAPFAEQLRVVAKTARIPFDCVVAGRRVPEEVAHQVQQALLAIDSDYDVSAQLRSTWGYGGFVAANPARYHDVAVQVRLDRVVQRSAPAPK